MKNLDKIEPIFYISEDNKKIIKNIEDKLLLIKIDDNIKKKFSDKINKRLKHLLKSSLTTLLFHTKLISLEAFIISSLSIL